MLFLKALFILWVAESYSKYNDQTTIVSGGRLLDDVKRCVIAFLSNKSSVFLETSSYIQVVT